MILPAIRLDAVELRVVELPLRTPFDTPLGTWTTRRVLLVTLRAGEDAGWGEVTAAHAPFYSAETTDLAVEVIARYLAPPLLDGTPVTPSDLETRWRGVRGHPMARAGVAGAVWDLSARSAGVSLSTALGGPHRDAVAGGIVLGTSGHDPARLLDAATRAAERGVTRLKLKIHPGWDARPLAAVRRALPGITLAADANGAYAGADPDALRPLVELGVDYVEEPLAPDDLTGLTALAARTGVRVALDESMTSARTLDTSAALGLVPVVNLKGGRVGGPGPGMEILHRTRSGRLDVFVGGMLSTCVGRLHDVALAAQSGVTLASDLAGSDWYFDTDLVDPPLRLRPDGTLVVPSEPGLGARVLLDRVEAATVLSRKVTREPG